MKSGISYKIFLLALVFVSAFVTSYAQEAGMSDVDIVSERETAGGEKAVFTTGDLKYIPKVSTALAGKDSIALNIQDFPMQQAALKATSEKSDEKQPQKKDDSILTFNFLYYIIQKYKLQDIID